MNRRQVLNGALASLSIPFLHSALPRSAWSAPPPAAPRRLVWWFMPNGMLMESFTPTTLGAGFALPPTLAEVADLQSRLTVISGLTNFAAQDSNGDQHGAGTSTILTDVPVEGSLGDLSAGISVDQVAANALGTVTPFPSMQLGTNEPELACAENDCVYRDNVSWAGPTTPLTPLSSPLVLFERMFGSADDNLTEEQAATRLLLRTSVLDKVDARASKLRATLGAADAAKLDEYLTGVRELESRIQQLASLQCTPPTEPPANPAFENRVPLLVELVAKAFECDLTRVVTFMTGASTSVTDYSFIGVANSHHTVSHHINQPYLMNDLTAINAWGIGRMGDLARALAGLTDSDGSDALANSMLMLATDLEDPNLHIWDDMPMLVMGGEAGGIVQGQHRVVANQPTSNLWLSALEFMGLEGVRFGKYATEPISLT